MTLLAIWQANTDTSYKVEHYQQDTSGDGYTLHATDSLGGETETEATAVAKTYTGFIENIEHQDRIPSGMIAGDGSLVLKLYYDRDLHSVTFEEEGGSLVGDIEDARYGSTVTLPTAPTKGVYTFGGWFTERKGGGSEFTSSTVVTRDIIVYAKWGYKVTFDSQGATVNATPSEIVAVAGSTIKTMPSEPEKIDYIFGGWFTEINGAGSKFTTTSFVNGDMIVYAKWGWSREKLERMIDGQEDVTKADTSEITDMSGLFYNNTTFNQDISDWDVSKVTNMASMFYGATAFNQHIATWDVSNVTSMAYMFYKAEKFNGLPGFWDVSSVTNMSSMFHGAEEFNRDLSDWDVSNVTTMRSMFGYTEKFNQDLLGWDVSSVTDMRFMFSFATAFNGDVSDWNVGKVENMSYMFRNASAFNQGLSIWDVSKVTNMECMFWGASSFNQSIKSWELNPKVRSYYFHKDSALTEVNVPPELWDEKNQ